MRLTPSVVQFKSTDFSSSPPSAEFLVRYRKCALFANSKFFLPSIHSVGYDFVSRRRQLPAAHSRHANSPRLPTKSRSVPNRSRPQVNFQIVLTRQERKSRNAWITWAMPSSQFQSGLGEWFG